MVGSTFSECQYTSCATEYALSYFACLLVYTWQIDLGYEGNIRRNIWILVAAMDLEAVDPVLVYALIMS